MLQSTALVSQRKQSCIRQVAAVTKVGVRQPTALVSQRKQNCIRQVVAAREVGVCQSTDGLII